MGQCSGTRQGLAEPFLREFALEAPAPHICSIGKRVWTWDPALRHREGVWEWRGSHCSNGETETWEAQTHPLNGSLWIRVTALEFNGSKFHLGIWFSNLFVYGWSQIHAQSHRDAPTGVCLSQKAGRKSLLLLPGRIRFWIWQHSDGARLGAAIPSPEPRTGSLGTSPAPHLHPSISTAM